MNRPGYPQVAFLAFALFAGSALQVPALYAQDASPATQQTAQRTDGQIEMDVVHALDASQPLKNDLITAATIQGEVTLSGTVASDANRKLAESIAAQVPGVIKVSNNLQVGNPQDAQNTAPPNNVDNGAPATDNQTAAAPPKDENPPADDQPADQSQYPQPYPQQPGYGNRPYPRARPQYGQYQQQQQQPYPAYEQAKGPVTIPQGTLLVVRTSEPVDSHHATPGTPVQFTVIQDVTYGGVLAIPRGAVVHGQVTDVQESGQLAGSPKLALTLTSLDLGGKTYPLQTNEFRVKGPNKAEGTAGKAVVGALFGAIIGGAAGGGTGAAIGAAAGGGAGTVASAASRGVPAWIPAEARVDFHLAAPVTVDPVNAREAARLAEGLNQGGPRLHRRAFRPYGPYGPRFAGPYPYAYGGYPYYGYPPVYYRPYIMMGGGYYWR